MKCGRLVTIRTAVLAFRLATTKFCVEKVFRLENDQSDAETEKGQHRGHQPTSGLDPGSAVS